MQSVYRVTIAVLVLTRIAGAETTPDPAYPVLERAFERLNAKDYDAAIALFRRAADRSPTRADIRKNLAYTLMKTGDTAGAREELARTRALDPNDHHLALEYAFLCHETGHTREARLVFQEFLDDPDPELRATARQAFDNIDGPLAEAIARWSEAVSRDPGNFSAREELARTAAKRSNWALAAEHFAAAWRIRSEDRGLLISLGEALRFLNREPEAFVSLLAASRGAEPRTAERARALLPARYPFVYEFRQAIALDAHNLELRRELAYLLLAMQDRDGAQAEFDAIVGQSPGDLLSAAQLGFLLWQRGETEKAQPLLERVVNAPDVDDELADRVRSVLGLPKTLRKRPETPKREVVAEAREMARRSYDAGYLKDALKYLSIAHENDPVDFSVMLGLARTHNMMHDDREALRWFEMAQNSADPSVAGEAFRATETLRPQLRRVRTTVWTLPFYSSRWKSGFTYGQVKTEFRLGRLPLRPYASLRLVGDTRGAIAQPYPQYLSETAMIPGVGVATDVYKGAMAWAEAGIAVSYLNRTDGQKRFTPDYRGGVSFSRGWGRMMGASSPGPFFENHEDAVWVNRFNNTLLFYSQNKLGYTLATDEDSSVQIYWNANVTGDAKRQYWANFADTGPGMRLRLPGMPPGMYVSIDVLRGAHLINKDNPRGPNYFDFRAGVWYAFSR
ncbi:MAG: tetratricopeptide repeat protein [Bryobacteraceae bacterium]